MSLTILIPILIHSLVLFLAILAIVYARLSYNTAPRKAVTELLAAMEEFETRLDRLDGKWKKLNANYASLRAETKTTRNGAANVHDEDGDDVDTRMRPGESPAEWKSRMRRAMQNGRLKHRSE
jgi:peptidoglycan hydrolase CwlO-like protein